MFSNAPPRAEFAPACHYGIALAAVATKQELQPFPKQGHLFFSNTGTLWMGKCEANSFVKASTL